MERLAARLTLLAIPFLVACGERQGDGTDEARSATDAAAATVSKLAIADAPPQAPVPHAAKEQGVQSAAAAPRSTSAAEVSAQSIAPADVAAAMLIRTGRASVRVDSLAEGIGRVRELARRTGALVANTTVSAGNEAHRAATIELRLPSERFDEVLNGLSPLGKLESVQVDVQDVGEEYTDVAARVLNARRLEARLIELLANRTGRLSDVLSVERELARVREEIERYEGRLRYLRARTSYSSLTVTVHERTPLVAPGPSPIAGALREAWRRFVWLVAAFIASLGVLVPLGGLVAGAWVLVRRKRRLA